MLHYFLCLIHLFPKCTQIREEKEKKKKAGLFSILIIHDQHWKIFQFWWSIPSQTSQRAGSNKFILARVQTKFYLKALLHSSRANISLSGTSC